MLDGQKLQGPPTAADIYQYLEQKAKDDGYGIGLNRVYVLRCGATHSEWCRPEMMLMMCLYV